ncbi:TIGR02270 family protein [Myxococcus qinghaiensis]|uniref:TIGR02270 family protein n=1 Tax=Myxococcus qinghaiensis TaxID=2906758 RepID=UPI0020A70D95|nr:TIGR02270 family protein [Myxococcus qinghaiensis]MCP3168174.1 TIGR02270 family protein [Myxococcus qinghaiensis]
MSRPTTPPPLHWDIAEEHLDEAAFLFKRWEESLSSPLFTPQEVADGPEERMLAHVDALALGGPRVARGLLLPRLSADSREESFAAGLALLGMEEDWSEAVLGVVQEGEPHQREGLREALRLTSRAGLEPHLLDMFDRSGSSVRAALLEVLVARRHPPPGRLDPLVAGEDSDLACAALRAARHFPNLLQQASLRQALHAGDFAVRGAALETGLILGLPEAWHEYEQAIKHPTESWKPVAVAWALGASGQDLEPLLRGLEAHETRRDALWALGFSGRLAAIEALRPWLRDEATAPVAAEAFAAITGLPLEPGFVLPPVEDAEAESPEGDLPFPDAGRIEAWWTEARSRFKSTERYMGGSPWSPERLLEFLKQAPMRRRPVLALELAIRTGGRCQFDTGLLAARQLRELERLRGALGRVPAGRFRELMQGWAPPPSAPRPQPAARPAARARTDGALVLTGMGMVSAIGHGAVESCASLRARIVRPRPLPFQVLQLDEPGTAVATGHPLRGLVDGFPGLARLIKLGALALEDVLRPAELSGGTTASFQQTALLLCLSSTRRDDFDFQDEFIAEQLPSRLLRHAGLALPVQNVSVIQAGHASGLLALQQASQFLQERRFQRVLVLGIDSLVEEDTLQWLASRRRLKTPEHPMGLMPGEAAAAMLLETSTEARRREASVLGTLAAMGTGRAPGEARQGAESGRVLAQTIRLAWPAGAPPVGDIYGDVNGEHSRALEWGFAQSMLRETHSLEQAYLHVPAECLGDTGAASGLISVCAALQGFVRGYAHGDQALVWSSSDSGEFAAARLSRA